MEACSNKFKMVQNFHPKSLQHFLCSPKYWIVLKPSETLLHMHMCTCTCAHAGVPSFLQLFFLICCPGCLADVGTVSSGLSTTLFLPTTFAQHLSNFVGKCWNRLTKNDWQEAELNLLNTSNCYNMQQNPIISSVHPSFCLSLLLKEQPFRKFACRQPVIKASQEIDACSGGRASCVWGKRDEAIKGRYHVRKIRSV